MRRSFVILLLGAAACSKKSEPQSLLIHFKAANQDAVPTRILVTSFGRSGVFFRDWSIPSTGTLVPDGLDLGTAVVLVERGAGEERRLLARGLVGTTAISEGTARVTPLPNRQTELTVTLRRGLGSDGDGDGVPDDIDDCPTVADPTQSGCAPPDAAVETQVEAGDVAPPDAADAGPDTKPADVLEGPLDAVDAALERPPDTVDAQIDSPPDMPPLRENGQSCALASQCKSGSCVDAVCCDSPSCGSCATCAGAPAGSCTTVGTGSTDDSCPGGLCWFGQCCTGCWESGSCVPGTSAGSCGKGGDPCFSCGTCHFCQDGLCTADTGVPCNECGTCNGGSCEPSGSCGTCKQCGFDGYCGPEPDGNDCGSFCSTMCEQTRLTCSGGECMASIVPCTCIPVCCFSDGNVCENRCGFGGCADEPVATCTMGCSNGMCQ